ncbi:MAG: hypothetical protein HXX13_09200 [Bacteroidetes bacterium]|nr:hypothetical protein [Bacteroidota bacterium]
MRKLYLERFMNVLNILLVALFLACSFSQAIADSPVVRAGAVGGSNTTYNSSTGNINIYNVSGGTAVFSQDALSTVQIHGGSVQGSPFMLIVPTDAYRLPLANGIGNVVYAEGDYFDVLPEVHLIGVTSSNSDTPIPSSRVLTQSGKILIKLLSTDIPAGNRTTFTILIKHGINGPSKLYCKSVDVGSLLNATISPIPALSPDGKTMLLSRGSTYTVTLTGTNLQNMQFSDLGKNSSGVSYGMPIGNVCMTTGNINFTTRTASSVQFQIRAIREGETDDVYVNQGFNTIFDMLMAVNQSIPSFNSIVTAGGSNSGNPLAGLYDGSSFAFYGADKFGIPASSIAFKKISLLALPDLVPLGPPAQFVKFTPITGGLIQIDAGQNKFMEISSAFISFMNQNNTEDISIPGLGSAKQATFKLPDLSFGVQNADTVISSKGFKILLSKKTISTSSFTLVNTTNVSGTNFPPAGTLQTRITSDALGRTQTTTSIVPGTPEAFAFIRPIVTIYTFPNFPNKCFLKRIGGATPDPNEEYTFQISVDPDNQVPESHEGNNTGEF